MYRLEKKIFFCLFLLVFTLMASMAFAQNKAQWPKKMNVACGPIGGAGFAPMSTWSNMMNGILGTNISPESTGGVTISLRMVNANDADFGAVTDAMCLEGWDGTGKWANGKKLRNFRTLFPVFPFALQFYALKSSNIKSIDDLNGKSINLSRAASSTDVWGRRIFKMFHIKVKVENQNPNDANGRLADRLLNASCVQGSLPHPAIMQATANNKIYVFGLPEKDIKVILKKYPKMREVHVPANVYQGQDYTFSTIASYMVLIANKDLPESLIYALTKTTFENLEKLGTAYRPFKMMKAENIKYLPIPMHEGAYKYFKEKGIFIPKAIRPVD